MKHESRRTMVWSLFTGVLLVSLSATAVLGQENSDQGNSGEEQAKPPKKVEAKAPSQLNLDDPKERKRLRLRLPTYYGRVVTDDQRQEIYRIQAQYNQTILKLKEELESLTAKRETEVKAVLSDEQQAEVAKYWAERRKNREGSSE